MRAYKIFNKIQNSLLIPFVFSSVIVSFSEILQLAGYKLDSKLDFSLSSFSSALISIIPYIFCCFATYYFTDDKRFFKSFWSAICLFMLSTAYGDDISFIVGIIVSLFCCFFFEKFNKYISLSVTIISSIIFGFFVRYIADVFNNLQMSIAYTISNKSTISSILFGALTTLLAIFDNKSFAELFFYKSYGGIIINGDNVITGIKDLVENGYSGELISNYLSGHYFLLFALVGIAVALSDEIKDKQKICLIVVTVATVLTGNISLLVLFLFFESWHLYLSVILLSALSFLASSLLDMKIGYMFNGGIIELILNINKPVYLFVGGLVFVAIGFFVAKYSHLKFGISDSLNIYIPSRLNNLVNSLGGIINIVKLNDDTIEIRNPKLVNNFELDCEIRENLVKLDSNKIGELKEYIK